MSVGAKNYRVLEEMKDMLECVVHVTLQEAVPIENPTENGHGEGILMVKSVSRIMV